MCWFFSPCLIPRWSPALTGWLGNVCEAALSANAHCWACRASCVAGRPAGGVVSEASGGVFWVKVQLESRGQPWMTLTKTSAAECFATKFWPYKSPALAGHLTSLKMADLGLTSDLSVYKLVKKVMRKETYRFWDLVKVDICDLL